MRLLGLWCLCAARDAPFVFFVVPTPALLLHRHVEGRAWRQAIDKESRVQEQVHPPDPQILLEVVAKEAQRKDEEDADHDRSQELAALDLDLLAFHEQNQPHIVEFITPGFMNLDIVPFST